MTVSNPADQSGRNPFCRGESQLHEAHQNTRGCQMIRAKPAHKPHEDYSPGHYFERSMYFSWHTNSQLPENFRLIEITKRRLLNFAGL